MSILSFLATISTVTSSSGAEAWPKNVHVHYLLLLLRFLSSETVGQDPPFLFDNIIFSLTNLRCTNLVTLLICYFLHYELIDMIACSLCFPLQSVIVKGGILHKQLHGKVVLVPRSSFSLWKLYRYLLLE